MASFSLKSDWGDQSLDLWSLGSGFRVFLVGGKLSSDDKVSDIVFLKIKSVVLNFEVIFDAFFEKCARGSIRTSARVSTLRSVECPEASNFPWCKVNK